MALPIATIRCQFPILRRLLAGHPLAYLDNAATTQKPECVLETMNAYYRTQNANAHRGMHPLAEEATERYENARKTVQKFLHAEHAEEIIFTKGCTEAINLVANTLSPRLPAVALAKVGERVRVRGFPPSPTTVGEGPGERATVVLSQLEHHSNIIPWMQRGARLHWIDIHDDGELHYKDLDRILAKNTTDLVTITGQSNVLGIQPDLKRIIASAHTAGTRVLIDAAQLVAHHPIDVQTLDCDFLAFSGHKLFGPTGIGVLYAKSELLEHMPPMLGGGGMVQTVNETSFIPLEPPARFEAGTPPVAEAVGLAAAIDWLSQFSWDDIIAHEQRLLMRAEEILFSISGIKILGGLAAHSSQLAARSGCLSFIIDGIHPHDLTEILGREGICLRAGHHCAEPLHRRFGVAASTRLSVALYNTIEEINRLPDAIMRAQKLLRGTPSTYNLIPIT